jgi:Domain of unknown function DUF29
MATKLGTKAAELYEADFYVWAERQAELLRAGRFDELDLTNLIEEVEDLGGALKRSVLNNAAVVMEHLLKLEHSPAVDRRNGWRASIREHRRRLRIELTPQLRQVLSDELAGVYEMAQHDAAAALRDHGEQAAAAALPEKYPYGVDQITGDWLP